MRKRMRVLASILATWGILQGVAQAAIPLQINYQGRVAVAGQPFDGNGFFRFTLADADSSLTLWCNDGSQVGLPASTTPTAAVNLPVINGIFNVRLGDTIFPNMTALPSTAFDDDRVVLRTWFDDGTHGLALLSPDQSITSVAYAFHAGQADTATTAAYAATAYSSYRSDQSDQSDLATTAAVALTANHAAAADTATTATYAANAGHANTATTATVALGLASGAGSAFMLPNYITGCELEWLSSSTIRVAPGAIELEGTLLTSGTYSATVDVSNAGNWLHGSEAANQWIYVYLGTDGARWQVKMSDEAPHSNDTSGHTGGVLRYRQYTGAWYRCIGAVRNDGSSNLSRFLQRGNLVMHDVPVLITTTPSPGSWSSPMSCSAGIPAVSTTGVFGLKPYGPGEAYCWIRPNGTTWINYDENGVGVLAEGSGDVAAGGQRVCATDASQQIEYSSHSGDVWTKISVEAYYLDVR